MTLCIFVGPPVQGAKARAYLSVFALVGVTLSESCDQAVKTSSSKGNIDGI